MDISVKVGASGRIRGHTGNDYRQIPFIVIEGDGCQPEYVLFAADVGRQYSHLAQLSAQLDPEMRKRCQAIQDAVDQKSYRGAFYDATQVEFSNPGITE